MGPVQILVIGYGADANFTGAALDELKRLREHDLVRVIDLLFVMKDEDGVVEKIEITDTEGLAELGAVAGALMGFGAAGEEGAELGALVGAEAALEQGSALDEDEFWYIADAIPEGTAAAVAVIEHRWAIPLRDAIRGAGGVPLADEWLSPEDLLAAGVEIGLEASL
jgi:uncharacterized membrane protein